MKDIRDCLILPELVIVDRESYGNGSLVSHLSHDSHSDLIPFNILHVFFYLFVQKEKQLGSHQLLGEDLYIDRFIYVYILIGYGRKGLNNSQRRMNERMHGEQQRERITRVYWPLWLIIFSIWLSQRTSQRMRNNPNKMKRGKRRN